MIRLAISAVVILLIARMMRIAVALVVLVIGVAGAAFDMDILIGMTGTALHQLNLHKYILLTSPTQLGTSSAVYTLYTNRKQNAFEKEIENVWDYYKLNPRRLPS
jgi:hypothetical protein